MIISHLTCSPSQLSKAKSCSRVNQKTAIAPTRNIPARYSPARPPKPPDGGATPGAAFPVPLGVVPPPPPLVAVPPLLVVTVVPPDVMVVTEPPDPPPVPVAVGEAELDEPPPPPLPPPVTVVVSWLDSDGRVATTVTSCAAVDAEGAYEVLVKPQVLIMASMSASHGRSAFFAPPAVGGACG